MPLYLLKRFLMTIVVLLLVTIALSLLIHIVPGDPARTVLGPRASPELIAKVRAAMDLDRPVPVQIGKFLWAVIHGDLGTDIFSGQPVSRLIGASLPHTLALAWAGLGLAVLLGIPLGVFSATHSDSWADRGLAVLSISLITIPSFVGGLFLLLLFAVSLGVLPATGVGKAGDTGDYLRHLLLPAVALALTWIGYLARLVRASLLEVMNETYIRAASASGLSRRLILYKYALKNALIPTVAVLGVGLGSLMGGAIFVEIIFSRPGMGTLIRDAILNRNYPVVRAGVLVVACVFVFANLLADISYTYLDPRIQLGKTRG